MLSEKAIAILKLIAGGKSYDQILAANQEFTYHDIFESAKEAVEADAVSEATREILLAQLRHVYPRAFMNWEPDEDERLREMAERGSTVDAIAAFLQRQPSAVRSRIHRLGVESATPEPAPHRDDPPSLPSIVLPVIQRDSLDGPRLAEEATSPGLRIVPRSLPEER